MRLRMFHVKHRDSSARCDLVLKPGDLADLCFGVFRWQQSHCLKVGERTITRLKATKLVYVVEGAFSLTEDFGSFNHKGARFIEIG